MRLIAFLTLLFAVPAHANCGDDLSIDQRYAEILRTTQKRSRDEGRALTVLMNEAIQPSLRLVSARVNALTHEQIVSQARVYQKHGVIVRSQLHRAPHKMIFDGQFTANESIKTTNYPCVAHNCALLRRLAIAVEIFNQSTEELIPLEPDETVLKSKMLLSARSFTKTDLPATLIIGGQTFLQAAAGLTADPVAELTPEEVLNRLMAPREKGLSLMMMYSLMLPPALLGPSGNRAYLRNPLTVQANGQLSFAPHFREFQKEARELFAQREREPFEFGFGCPVAHCTPGAAQPALQDFFDAIMYLYRNVPADWP